MHEPRFFRIEPNGTLTRIPALPPGAKPLTLVGYEAPAEPTENQPLPPSAIDPTARLAPGKTPADEVARVRAHYGAPYPVETLPAFAAAMGLTLMDTDSWRYGFPEAGAPGPFAAPLTADVLYREFNATHPSNRGRRVAEGPIRTACVLVCMDEPPALDSGRPVVGVYTDDGTFWDRSYETLTQAIAAAGAMVAACRAGGVVTNTYLYDNGFAEL